LRPRSADDLHVPVDRRLKPLPLLVAACLGVVLGLWLLRGDPGGPQASSPHDAPNLGPANIPLPPGEWEATGRVVWVAPNVSTNQPAGTILKRPWSFHRVCHGTCRVMFARWTLYGPSVTRLAKQGRFFIARFPPVRVPCAYPRGSSYPRHRYGQSHDRYRLWWSDDGATIRAVEQRTQTGCYGRADPPDLTRWRATRVPRITR
jgi:hypothetical protein